MALSVPDSRNLPQLRAKQADNLATPSAVEVPLGSVMVAGMALSLTGNRMLPLQLLVKQAVWVDTLLAQLGPRYSTLKHLVVEMCLVPSAHQCP